MHEMDIFFKIMTFAVCRKCKWLLVRAVFCPMVEYFSLAVNFSAENSDTKIDGASPKTQICP
jgi:hypothetical protein